MWLSRNGLRLGFVLVAALAGGRRGCCSGCPLSSDWSCIAPSVDVGCGRSGESCCTARNNDAGFLGCTSGTSCIADVCVEIEPTCGASGQRCCSGANCAAALACMFGTCAPCGNRGQLCCEGRCPGGGICAEGMCGPPDAGLRDAAVDAGAFAQCGRDDQPCCNGGVCLGARMCLATGVCSVAIVPPPCGGLGQACCASDRCQSPLQCTPLYVTVDAGDDASVDAAMDAVDEATDAADDVTDAADDITDVPAAPGVCLMCGTFGAPCCGGGACDPGLACEHADVNRCLPCGSVGHPCCASRGCVNGAVCAGDAGGVCASPADASL